MRWDAAFGTPAFIAALDQAGPFDVLCHHAANATNYKSPDFDALAATQANCLGLPDVLEALKRNGCRRILLTGSVFEANEGAGTQPLHAFSPYGLSKTLTTEMFRFYAQRAGVGLGKFVIPNPFGPYEGPRFPNFLLRCWASGTVARINTPAYVRDNVPVSLLALAYADALRATPEKGFRRFSPSYYVETQAAFAQRFAQQIGPRLKMDTPLEMAEQTDFSEPMTRINTDRILVAPGRWSEDEAWDEAAKYYKSQLALDGTA
jgi:nucleoside-diphosphate-sugar epimerase